MKFAKQAFTQMEIIMTATIMIVIAMAAITYTVGYVAHSRRVSDQGLLMTLNQAISGYKAQGGDLGALTAGKPFENLVTLLKTPRSWAGLNEPFLNEQANFAGAITVAADGSGSNFHLTRYNTYDEGGGANIPLTAPGSFGGEVQRVTTGSYTHSSFSITLAQDIPAGSRLVIVSGDTHTDDSPKYQSVTDTKGNTWGVDAFNHAGSNRNTLIMSTSVENALTTSDQITLTLWSNHFTNDNIALFVIHNAQTVVGAESYGAYSSTVSLTETVSAAPAVGIGIVHLNGTTLNSSNWNSAGANLGGYALFYQDFDTTGSKTLTCSLSASVSYSACWVAYK